MSSLSFDKLELYIQSLHYNIQRVYVKDSCVYAIELLTPTHVHNVFLRIPPKYRFNIPANYSSYTLTSVKVNIDKNDDMDNFVTPSETMVHNTYKLRETLSLPDNMDLVDHLNDAYKKGVILEDMKNQDIVMIKSIHRQIKRIQYCVHGMQYNVGIMKSPYLAITEYNPDSKDTEILLYHIGNTSYLSSIRLYLVIDLGMFYSKSSVIEQECNQIIKGIHKVLRENDKHHTDNINKLIKQQTQSVRSLTQLQKHRNTYQSDIEDNTLSLRDLQEREDQKLKELQTLHASIPSGNIHKDMKIESKCNSIQRELKELDKLKRNLIKTLHELQNSYNNITLKVDAILFDNIILLDKINQNFNYLSKLK